MATLEETLKLDSMSQVSDPKKSNELLSFVFFASLRLGGFALSSCFHSRFRNLQLQTPQVGGGNARSLACASG